MKKMLLLMALTSLVLVACDSNTEVEAVESTEDVVATEDETVVNDTTSVEETVVDTTVSE